MATLSIGCTFSDRIEALLDGRVRIAGQEAALHIVEPQRLFRAVLRDAAYDVAELSMASHVAAVAAGRRDYVGVPVFLSRSFRHANLYVRTYHGIDRPEDLAGRTIGLVDWQQTAALSLRGLLTHEHGVARESIRWVAAGLHAPVLDNRAGRCRPASASNDRQRRSVRCWRKVRSTQSSTPVRYAAFSSKPHPSQGCGTIRAPRRSNIGAGPGCSRSCTSSSSAARW